MPTESVTDTAQVADEPVPTTYDPLDGTPDRSMASEPVEPVVGPDDPLDGTSDRDTV